MSYIYLLIEFLDELVFGLGETAWPFIRTDLDLTYTQIGLLLSVPGIIAAFIEPFLGILGDVWKRRLLILGGGVFFTFSLILTTSSKSFTPLLIAFIIFFPASGAFVSLSQAALMDSAPERHAQNMARWTSAGSLGNVFGPILLGLFVYFGLGWRGAYALAAAVSALCLLAAFRLVPLDDKSISYLPSFKSVFDGFRSTLSALKRREVWRWLLLLEASDLMLDVFLGFLALYFVDVAQATPTQAGIAVTVWLTMGMLTDFIFIPFIDRQPDSMKFLRRTATIELLAFSIFLLIPDFIPKLIAIVFINIFNTGWYPILKGNLYSTLPGQSASIMAIESVTTPIAKLLPLFVGLLADHFGLGIAIWLLLLGPLALIIGLPRHDKP
ncbi:MFS transporter [Candidatus Villigracilis saccharophilus]|uniref:MFS transporter n=1 Tax=Candidatus Villigracilis saccharophilus TaxID=3140684 RepID=UPI003135736B|nr:MFS transporter [Anaerolineales bacterium]